MHMNQKIFDLGLSAEIISTYLLCTGLADSEAPLSHENILSIWSGERENLEISLMELEKRKIILKKIDDGSGSLYVIQAVDLWIE